MQNITIEEVGDNVVLTVPKNAPVINPAGGETSTGKPRKYDLVGKTGGIEWRGNVGISGNVFRRPAKAAGKGKKS